jgi:hypothetical protein
MSPLAVSSGYWPLAGVGGPDLHRRDSQQETRGQDK